jgi:hypothetical protein
MKTSQTTLESLSAAILFASAWTLQPATSVAQFVPAFEPGISPLMYRLPWNVNPDYSDANQETVEYIR